MTYSIVNASDGGTVSGDTVTWDDIGPIPPGEAKAVTIKMKVADTSASGGTEVLGVQAAQGQGGELPKTGGITAGAALALMAAAALVRRLRT